MKSHVRHFFGGGFPMVALPQYDIRKVPFLVFWLQLPASHTMQQDISVWVRDPRIQNTDFWHAYIDYEICLLTNSLCFTKKISCTRRRFSEFVWLRQRLQVHSLLISKLPQMPPKNLFFSLNSARQISERMKGLQTFLEHPASAWPRWTPVWRAGHATLWPRPSSVGGRAFPASPLQRT
ncbi:sorting nexin-10B-like isoform X3 [Gadus macrocephalus]|uniref:sorting nexin-10B-like isoform X3 n=1 Tax=Gadus macrocephalus TaxID=80720 RepID=UPI0028CB3B02|nr:sorting nexin-10B-like isoform X3 [Gadus macrocephalus]